MSCIFSAADHLHHVADQAIPVLLAAGMNLDVFNAGFAQETLITAKTIGELLQIPRRALFVNECNLADTASNALKECRHIFDTDEVHRNTS